MALCKAGLRCLGVGPPSRSPTGLSFQSVFQCPPVHRTRTKGSPTQEEAAPQVRGRVSFSNWTFGPDDSGGSLSRRVCLGKSLYSSSRLVTLLKLGWGGPRGEELLRSSVAEGLMGADGVVGPLPVLEFLVELGDLERAGGDLIKLLRMPVG